MQGRHSKKIWSLFFLAILALLSLAFYLSRESEQEEKSVTLPDSSVLTLKGITYGKNHFAPGSKRWHRIGRFLPPALQNKLGLTNYTFFSTPEPAMVVWVIRSNDPLMNSGLITFDAPVLFCDAVDEEGYIVSTGWYARSFSTSLPGNATLYPYQLNVYPRRQKSFKLQFYNRWKLTIIRPMLAEFEISNPQTVYPTWKAEPLPASRRQGDLEFILTKANFGARERGITNLTVFARGADFRFKIKEHGRFVHTWEPQSAELFDATGNQIHIYPDPFWRLFDGSENTSEETGLTSSTILTPNESAYKFKVGFVRTAEAHFEPDELWIVRNFDPRSHTPTLRINMQGINIEVAAEKVQWPGFAGPYTSKSERFNLNFKTSANGSDSCLRIIRLTDEMGREINVSRGASSETESSYPIEFPSYSHTLTFTLAVQKQRFVEYLVKPETK